ncbi:MAG: hypothetical protein ACRD3S_20285 [Terracidiphilus sp.]
MGLSESKIKDLAAKKFDKLLDKHEKKWREMAMAAHDFAKEHISGGHEPRPDDIHKALLPMLEVNEELRKHQEDNKARYRRYREHFADLIIDRHATASQEESA